MIQQNIPKKSYFFQGHVLTKKKPSPETLTRCYLSAFFILKKKKHENKTNYNNKNKNIFVLLLYYWCFFQFQLSILKNSTFNNKTLKKSQKSFKQKQCCVLLLFLLLFFYFQKPSVFFAALAFFPLFSCFVLLYLHAYVYMQQTKKCILHCILQRCNKNKHKIISIFVSLIY